MRNHDFGTFVAAVLTTCVLLSPEPRLGPAAAQARGPGRPAAPVGGAERQERPIDMVICLDTSGSMTELIDSARGRIWDIVTELSKATPTPRLRIGLLTYGTPDTSTAEKGWVVRQIDLTDDLDAFYAKMMALTTRGGDEFVGWVLSDAVHTMSWTGERDALKLIFVAGNESADQASDQRNFRYVTEQARGADIIVNPIYAGDRDQGIRELWDQVAMHGGGNYAAIDAEHGTVQIATPYDPILRSLNDELNATYVPYGDKGGDGLANLLAQDTNAGRLGVQSCSSRVAAKGSALYNNAKWDLVDAVGQHDFRLVDVKTPDLPVYMRSMTQAQRATYVNGMRAVRVAVQARIQETDTLRRAFVSAERIKSGVGKLSLDESMLQSLRAQARAKGFMFPDDAPAPVTTVMGPELPQPWLKPIIRENIDALIASMPALEYRVGGYRTKHAEFASVLTKHTAQSLSYYVGVRRFATETEARESVAELLEREADALQTIQVVPGCGSPFPYANSGLVASPAPAGATQYRVGGINFVDRSIADQVVRRIREAVATFDSSILSKTNTEAATQRDNPNVRLVAHSDGPSTKRPVPQAYFDGKIRTITETAGRAYMDLVDGC